MSQSQIVDGRTGEPIGYNIYSVQQREPREQREYVTTTSSYVPAAPVTSYSYGTGSAYQTREYAVGGAQRPEYTSERREYAVGGAQIVGTTVNTGKEVIKGESRIEYVPFEKKVIEYKDQAKVERVPKKVKKIEYREERTVERVPKQVTVTDYYAVEYLRQYIPQYVPEKRIEYVQVPKKQVRYEYIPVERQIVHYPDQALEERGAVERVERVIDTRVEGRVLDGRVDGRYNTGYVVEERREPVVYQTGQQVVYQTVPGERTYQIEGDRNYEQRYYTSGYPEGQVVTTTEYRREA